MTIAEVSELYGLSADTLRYYERIGLIPAVPRNKSGIRDYRESDRSWVEFIKCMRQAGLPVEVLIEYVGLFQKGDETIAARKEILMEQRELLAAKISALQQTYERLNRKVESYDLLLLKKEQELAQSDTEIVSNFADAPR